MLLFIQFAVPDKSTSPSGAAAVIVSKQKKNTSGSLYGLQINDN
jgi:hypothetical protein